jgi:hypothetical protein
MSDLCMSDIDNYLCHGATTLLIKSLGDKSAMDFIYQTMNAISLHYRSISVPKIINLDFLVGYMSTQAFAIPAIWHAKRMKMITTKSKRDDLYIYRALADVKYRAFALGLIPVGTRVDNGIAKLVVWKGSKS